MEAIVVAAPAVSALAAPAAVVSAESMVLTSLLGVRDGQRLLAWPVLIAAWACTAHEQRHLAHALTYVAHALQARCCIALFAVSSHGLGPV
jgi:hypothetical protein